MLLLVLGLLVLLTTHSVRIFAEPWRLAQQRRMGVRPWQAAFGAVSLLGFVLMVWGYGIARANPVILWFPPVWTRHLAALLVLIAFVLLAAAYVPGTRIKAAIGHPMVAAVKVWALAHLLANGTLHDVLLFGAFLAWAVAAFAAARRRDRAAGVRYPAAGIARDVLALVVGVLAWGAFAMFGHAWLIGVRPFG
jgi:uncharacterized membrane protein